MVTYKLHKRRIKGRGHDAPSKGKKGSPFNEERTQTNITYDFDNSHCRIVLRNSYKLRRQRKQADNRGRRSYAEAQHNRYTIPPETTTSSTSPVSTTTEISETTTEKPIETTKPITPPETGTYINPLTGLKTSVTDPSNKRPVAIVVDNISNAYKNQKGLYQADILYEALVAPGITRYVAIIEDYESVKDICNVRSGRDYHIDIAQGHNAILVCHGGSITNNYNFYQLVISRLGSRYAFVDTKDEYVTGTEEGGKKYGTIQNYKSRSDLLFDTVVNGSALKIMVTGKSSRFAKSGAGYTDTPNGFKFGTSSASSSSISAKQ